MFLEEETESANEETESSIYDPNDESTQESTEESMPALIDDDDDDILDKNALRLRMLYIYIYFIFYSVRFLDVILYRRSIKKFVLYFIICQIS